MHRKATSTLITALALGLWLLGSAAWAAEAVDVRLGYSELVRTEEPADTVIVGNDQIANATVAAGNTIVVTGNALGSTNLILLDETGAEVASSVVRVVPVDPRPQQTVRVISGGANETASVYVCGPEPGCAPSDGGDLAPPAGEAGAEAVEEEDAAQPEETPSQ